MDFSGLFVFLLLFTFLKASVVERYYMRKYGKKNVGTLTTEGLLKCGFKCNQVSNCVGFRYKANNKSCERLENSSPEQKGWDQWVSECLPPPTVQNAKVDYGSNLPGSRAVYTCPDLYTWRGTNESTCLPQLFWSPIGICYQYKWTNKKKEFSTKLLFGLPAKSVISLVGKPMSTERFTIALWQNKVICQLYIRGLFNYNEKQRIVEFGESINKTAGKDLTIPQKDFPFSFDKQFAMSIVVETYRFKVTVDKKILFVFDYNFNPEDISLFVTSNLEIVDMTFEPEKDIVL